MAFQIPARPMALQNPTEVFDLTAAKVFLNLEEMLNHPVGTYMARLGPDTRETTERLLRIARDTLTDKQTSLKEFP